MRGQPFQEPEGLQHVPDGDTVRRSRYGRKPARRDQDWVYERVGGEAFRNAPQEARLPGACAAADQDCARGLLAVDQQARKPEFDIAFNEQSVRPDRCRLCLESPSQSSGQPAGPSHDSIGRFARGHVRFSLEVLHSIPDVRQRMRQLPGPAKQLTRGHNDGVPFVAPAPGSGGAREQANRRLEPGNELRVWWRSLQTLRDAPAPQEAISPLRRFLDCFAKEAVTCSGLTKIPCHFFECRNNCFTSGLGIICAERRPLAPLEGLRDAVGERRYSADIGPTAHRFDECMQVALQEGEATLHPICGSTVPAQTSGHSINLKRVDQNLLRLESRSLR